MEIIIPASGILSKNEIKKFKMMLIESQIKEKYNKALALLNIKRYMKFDFKGILIPDSSLCSKAIEEAQDSFNSILFYHSYRTYFWSAGFALSEKLNIDNELLFVSSILHDIGLSEKHNHICSKQCFANYGGEFSQNFCLENGLDKNKATIVKQAIDMHLNPVIDREKYGNESYFLSKGAAMDVIGLNKFQLTKKFILEVDKSYSRKGFKQDIIYTMENFHHREGTRADILYKMGFAQMAGKNALDEE